MASMIDPEQSSIEPKPALATGVPPRRAFDSGWVWMGVACVLITASGLVRVYQDRQFGVVRSNVPPCPFPIEQVPDRIGDWASLPEGEVKLDPLTIRITGSSDHILRTYQNELTGGRLSLLVLYGPAEAVSPHTPEVCYPATGYDVEMSGSDVTIPVGDHAAQFRQAVYSRSGGGRRDRAKVSYSFRLEGDWAPDIAVGKKFHRINAGIIKVQIQRVLGPSEVADSENEPIDGFLGALLPEIEGLIARGHAAPTQTASR
jgi:hypothetical protein